MTTKMIEDAKVVAVDTILDQPQVLGRPVEQGAVLVDTRLVVAVDQGTHHLEVHLKVEMGVTC